MAVGWRPSLSGNHGSDLVAVVSVNWYSLDKPILTVILPQGPRLGSGNHHHGRRRSSLLDHLHDHAQVHHEIPSDQGYL